MEDRSVNFKQQLSFAAIVHGRYQEQYLQPPVKIHRMLHKYSLVLIFSMAFFNAHAFDDSVIVAASSRYHTQFMLRRAFVGNNYRAAWELPVKMPIFDMREKLGGLTITKLGGGAQSKSLRFKDKESVEWVLRTVDKDVRKIVPPALRGSIVHGVMQDIISTAYPYAPLIVGELAKTVGIFAPEPQLYFVPDDPAFGEYQKFFANQVCMFEKFSPGAGDNEAISTDSLVEVLNADRSFWVDEKSYLTGRLLDMLIADWDRHKDQLKWVVGPGGKKFYPIFRDRDQAFFYSDGWLLMKTRLFTLKHFTNFNKRSIRKLKRLNWKSWQLDEALLKRLSEEEWRTTTENFIRTLNDKAIESAVKKLPPEAYARDAEQITNILKARRDGMLRYTMEYYKFISGRVKKKGDPMQQLIPKLIEAKDKE